MQFFATISHTVEGTTLHTILARLEAAGCPYTVEYQPERQRHRVRADVAGGPVVVASIVEGMGLDYYEARALGMPNEEQTDYYRVVEARSGRV